MMPADDRTGPDDEVQFIPPEEPRIRVLGFRCEACKGRVGVFIRLSQDPPRTEKERTEIERSARGFHELHTCKSRRT